MKYFIFCSLQTCEYPTVSAVCLASGTRDSSGFGELSWTAWTFCLCCVFLPVDFCSGWSCDHCLCSGSCCAVSLQKIQKIKLVSFLQVRITALLHCMLALSHGKWTEFMCINTDLPKHSTQQPHSLSHFHTHIHTLISWLLDNLHWGTLNFMTLFAGLTESMWLFQRSRPAFLTTASERGTRWCSTAGRSWERSVRSKTGKKSPWFDQYALPSSKVCGYCVYRTLCCC